MNVKKLFVIAVINCYIATIFSQDINVSVVSNDTIPLAYTSVYLKNVQIGVMTDTTGQFSLPNTFLNHHLDTLIVSCVGYKIVKIPVSDLIQFFQNTGNKIILDTDILTLDEVTVYSSSGTSEDFGFYNLKSSNTLLSGKPGSRVCVFIENTAGITKIIQNVKIKVDKQNDKTKKLQLFFCSKSDDGFIVNDFTEDNIIISDFSKKNLIVDVSKYSIPFTEDGIYIGVEWIASENILQDMSEKIGLSVKCTSKNKTKSTWIYQNEKWVQFPPLSEEELSKIPRIFRNRIMNANAQIGIVAK